MGRRYFIKSDFSLNLICIFLSLAFFFIDIHLPWAIGSVLYVIVILTGLLGARRKTIFYLAALVTILTLTGAALTLPASEQLRYMTNHLLVIGIIWTVAWGGLQFKKEQELNAFLASIVDSSNDVIIGKTVEGTIKSWNKAAEKILGYKPEEAVGKPSSLIIPPEKLNTITELHQKVKNKEYIHHYETIRRTKDGRLIPVSLSLSPILDIVGNVIGFSSIARDISKEIAVRENEERLNAIIKKEKLKLEEVILLEEGANSILRMEKLMDFIVENTAKVLEAERCSLMLLDKSNNSLAMKANVGLDEEVALKKIMLGDPVAGIVAQNGKPVLVKDIETDEHFARSKRPFYKTKSFISSPITLNDQIIGLINVADKQSLSDGNVFTELDLKILTMIGRQTAVALENSRLYRELNYLTITDPLTGIKNFRFLTVALDQEILRSKRYGRPLSLCMIDVDNFKSYNDDYGHIEGDHLLKTIAKVLTENVRQMDIVCRYAGDEFVIILPETDKERAQKVAEKLTSKIRSMDFKRKVTISLGLASFHNNFERLEFIKKADIALYEAKKNGKNCVYALR